MFAIIAISAVVIFGLFSTAILRLERTVARIAAFYLFSYANIILISRIAGTIYRLSDTTTWLVLHLLFAVSAASVWWWVGKPSLRLFDPTILKKISWRSRENWLTIFLFLITAFSYLVLAGIILIVPPNNWDGMAYRLPRIMYWLQFDTFYPHVTPDVRITTFPQNSEIAILWTFLIRGTDQFAGYVQWVGSIVSAIVIFDLTRLIGGTSKQGVFVACLWLSFPLIIAESTSVQNDIVVGTFFIISVYGLYNGVQANSYRALMLSGLAVGMAIGTKSTIIFALPGFALAAAIIWLSDPRRLFRPMAMWAIYSIIGFILLGSYSYIINFIAYGDPVGATESYRNTTINDSIISLRELSINLPRYLYQMLDFSAIPSGESLNKAKTDIIEDLFNDMPWVAENNFPKRVYFTRGEDVVWFGVLGIIVLLPSIGWGLITGIRRQSPYILGLALMAMSFMLIHSAIQPWTPYKGRYYIIMSVIGATLMIWVMNKIRLILILRWGISAIAVLSFAYLLALNTRKPLIGDNSILSPQYDRYSSFVLTRSGIIPFLDTFDENIPDNASVRTARLSGSIWLYPYWGPNFTRTIIPVPTLDRTYNSLEEIAAANPQLLIGLSPQYPPSDFVLIDEELLQTLSSTDGFEQINVLNDIGIVEYLFRRIGE